MMEEEKEKGDGARLVLVVRGVNRGVAVIVVVVVVLVGGRVGSLPMRSFTLWVYLDHGNSTLPLASR